jgi:hypothetical protein
VTGETRKIIADLHTHILPPFETVLQLLPEFLELGLDGVTEEELDALVERKTCYPKLPR